MLIDFKSDEYWHVVTLFKMGTIDRGFTFAHGCLKRFVDLVNEKAGEHLRRFSNLDSDISLLYSNKGCDFLMKNLARLNRFFKEKERAQGVKEREVKGFMSIPECDRQYYISAVDYFMVKQELAHLKKIVESIDIDFQSRELNDEEMRSYTICLVAYTMIMSVCNCKLDDTFEHRLKNCMNKLRKALGWSK